MHNMAFEYGGDWAGRNKKTETTGKKQMNKQNEAQEKNNDQLSK